MAGFMRNAKRRAEKRSLTQKILTGLTAFGVMTGPWFAQLAAANAIEKADPNNAATITTNGAVTNVLADSAYGDNAINTFKHFPSIRAISRTFISARRRRATRRT